MDSCGELLTGDLNSGKRKHPLFILDPPSPPRFPDLPHGKMDLVHCRLPLETEPQAVQTATRPKEETLLTEGMRRTQEQGAPEGFAVQKAFRLGVGTDKVESRAVLQCNLGNESTDHTMISARSLNSL